MTTFTNSIDTHITLFDKFFTNDLLKISIKLFG
ncbi:Uncharacterised protein [Pseudomonas aeruginosa]|nr:Uncharacterised protein [Pseudomonas putida]CAB5725310.1 Uncharacterised protein [Pseudomonas aeruginosa]